MGKKKVTGEDGKTYVMKEKKPFYKKVWFWIVVVLAIAIGANMGGGDKDKKVAEETPKTTEKSETTQKSEAAKESVAEKEETKTADEQYQAILDDYTQKIKDAAPKLAAEYIEEAKNNQGGLEGLAQLSNDKVSELAEISNDGISEMANVHFKSGTGKYEDYEAWATKLTNVYMDEAQIITDAYMDSAQ